MANCKIYHLTETLAAEGNSTEHTINLDIALPVYDGTTKKYALDFTLDRGNGDLQLVTPQNAIEVNGMHKEYELKFDFYGGYKAPIKIQLDIAGKLKQPVFSGITSTRNSIYCNIKNPNSVACKLYYRLSTTNTWSTTTVGGGTGAYPFSVGNLSANTTYTVYAYFESPDTGKYLNSTTVSQAITTTKGQVPAPTISLASRTTTQQIINFKNNASYAITLFYRRGTSGNYSSATVAANATKTVTYSGLTAGTSYTYSAFATASSYDNSSTVSVTYKTYYGTLSTPVLYVDEDATPDIRVTNNNNTTVNVLYNTSPGGTGIDIGTIGPNTYAWKGGSIFNFSTEYFFKFTATDWADSNWTTGKTPGKKLLSPQVTIQGNFATVTNPNGVAATLYYRPSTSGSNLDGGSISANSSKTIGGLVASTTYYFFFIENKQWLQSDYTTKSTLAALTAPTLRVDDDTVADINVTNPNSVTVDVYYRKNNVDTKWGSLTAGQSKWFSSGINFGETIGVWFANSSYPNSSVSSIYVKYPSNMLVAPVCSYDYDGTPDIKVTNNNEVSVDVYYNTINSNSGGTKIGTLSAKESSWFNSGFKFDTYYYIFFKASGYTTSATTKAYTGYEQQETETW